MTDAIRFLLSNVPAIMFATAIVIATSLRDGRPASHRVLDWMLLLSVGVETLWAGLFHVFVPHVAAASIGGKLARSSSRSASRTSLLV